MSLFALMLAAPLGLVFGVPSLWFLRGDACGEVIIRTSDDVDAQIRVATVPSDGAGDPFALSFTAVYGSASTYTAGSYVSPAIGTFSFACHPGDRYVVRVSAATAENDTYPFVCPACQRDALHASGNLSAAFFVGDTGSTSAGQSVLRDLQLRLSAMGFTPSLSDADPPPGAQLRSAASVFMLGDLAYADGDPLAWDTFQVGVLTPRTRFMVGSVSICIIK
jgi:hypothetical protein